MLRQAAAMFVRLAAVFALELACSSLVLLAQMRTVASSSHLRFRLLAVLEGREGRSVYNGHVLWNGSVLGQAARVSCMPNIKRRKGRLGHGAAAIDDRALGHGIVQRSTIDSWPSECRALAPIDTVCRVHGAQRSRVRVRAAVRVARGQAVRRRAHRKAMLSRWTRHGDFLGTRAGVSLRPTDTQR